MERVADYVVGRLVEQNIDYIFLITGRGILYLTDAVAKNKEVQGVSTYHEQGASYAAMAYASAKGGMGACLVSTGCAATNAVTAVLCAYQDNLPVIFISGQNMLKESTRYTGVPIRTYGSQEADIINIVQSITKYAAMVDAPGKIRQEIDKAIYYANEGRKGPVWIDIPLDIQNARIEASQLTGWESSEKPYDIPCGDIEYVINAFRTAVRPVVFLGGGVRSSNAMEQVATFVDKYSIPVVSSASAADAYGTAHPLSIGVVGSLGGSRAGNFAVQNADLILVLGSKLCSQTIGAADQFAREAKIIVVDIDPQEHTKVGADIDRIIIADIKEFMSHILDRELRTTDREWVEKCLRWKEIFAVHNETFIHELLCQDKMDLYYFATVLSDKLPDDATVITDAGLEELIIPSSICYRKTQRCLFPASQGAMGYAIPAILGAFYAGKRNIVAVVGDGSFMMNMQELLAVSAQHIPAKIFVINNNMYAIIRKRQNDLFRTRTIGNDPSDGVAAPDFQKIAGSFGFAYMSIKKPEQLASGIEEVLASEDSYICEVSCVEDQKYFHTSYAINESHKLVKRPLEDLSPFIDRQLFYSEMVAAPIQE
ncbi:MAG: thiamine pyrophosphate-binding protein [Acetatifactor sp.]